MYDLPSEFPEELGLPDRFHNLRPWLLEETFRPPGYSRDRRFVATDLCVYYDVEHPLWQKRPDWFAVLGVPMLYGDRELRLSYVMWQEEVAPAVVVELLSPGTRDEDLGQTPPRRPGRPPTKWTVYEEILEVPYYAVFDARADELRVFRNLGKRFVPVELAESRVWLDEVGLGLGVWRGTFQGSTRRWLRWFDASGQWVLTDAEQERSRAEQERSRADRLAERLRSLGIDPDEG